MNLTHQQLRMLARWMRRLGDEVHGVEEVLALRVANYLDAQAASMEAAAAPAQPAAAEPRCDRCRWWVWASYHEGFCKRFPPTREPARDGNSPRWKNIITGREDFCGEFAPREVTK